MEDITANFDDYQNRVTTALVATTRAVGQIAAGDLSFHRASSSAVSAALDTQSMRLLQLTNKLLRAVNRPSAAKPVPKLRNQDHVEDNWRGIVDVIDSLLEKADRNLDEFTGVIKQVGSSSKPITDTSPRIGNIRGRPSVASSQALPKPQLQFDVKVNNFESGAWKPLLTAKPHARIPLEQSVIVDKDGFYTHPYEREIHDSTYPPSVYDRAIPIQFQDPGTTPITFIDTERGVSEMLEELKKAKEIAVDLEHHDTHSYVGLTCLMQISTREKDWVIDTLQPWRQNLRVLNKVFADPHILKVLHGASMDIIWLQRDLGLYVVGLFDTYHAASALHLPGKSLKYLLSTYAGFDADKKYQLADWRLRPLPAEQLEYARSDTHYLLYVYDQLRNQLIERSLHDNDMMDYVLRHSKEAALQRYSRLEYQSKTGLGPNGWFSLVVRRPGKFTTQQFAVFRAVHEWRDRTARALDESPFSVMSMRTLDSIALLMPSTVPELMTAATPVSNAVQKGKAELVRVIKEAKEEGKDGLSISQVIQENDQLFTERDSAPGGPRLDAYFFTPSIDEQHIERALAKRASQSRLWGKASPMGLLPFDRVSGQITTGLKNLLWPTPNPPNVSDSISEKRAPVENRAVERTEPKTNDLLYSLKQDGILTVKHTDRSPEPAFEGYREPRLQDENSSDDDSEDSSDHSILSTKSRFQKSGTTDGLIENGHPRGQQTSTKGSHAEGNSQSTNGDNGQATNVQDAVHAEEDFSKLSKGQRQRRRRKAKKQALAAVQSTEAPQTAPMVPLDYASAKPVLEGSKSQPNDGKTGAKRPRPFDPYAKALDAPSGKKTKKESKGKSLTFH